MSNQKYYVLIIFTTLLMGVAFPVGKIGMAYIAPFLLIGIRFVLAGGILAGWTIVRKLPQPQHLSGWMKAAVIGLVQSVGVMGCAYYSMHWITSGESAIITSSSPLIVVLFGTLFNGVRYQPLQWLGVALGFTGIALSFGFHIGLQPGTWIALLGALCFAVATLLIKRWGSQFHMTVLAAY